MMATSAAFAADPAPPKKTGEVLLAAVADIHMIGLPVTYNEGTAADRARERVANDARHLIKKSIHESLYDTFTDYVILHGIRDDIGDLDRALQALFQNKEIEANEKMGWRVVKWQVALNEADDRVRADESAAYTALESRLSTIDEQQAKAAK